MFRTLASLIDFV
ncbi:hypothetical protein F383_07630 [Gossypium arboreum]|uniref:Uncharacterized protein n=1 Tax=Gossypium arboreum TaxID=29729 RepID=A0A0B0NY56_GOSAR|nr:hypothetical protein F383_07630 [Gossypium arboreum]